MRPSKIICYVSGCMGLLTVGAALAKPPAQTVEHSLATPVPKIGYPFTSQFIGQVIKVFYILNCYY